MTIMADAAAPYPGMARRLRLGLVGGGQGALVGQWHAGGARLSGRWEIVAGALSSDPERALASGRDWLLAPERTYASFSDMAAREAARPDGIDAVAVCTPNHTHRPEDTAFMGIRLEGGAPGTLWVTQAAAGNYCGLRLRVFGTRGGIEWDQEQPERLRLNLLGQPEQVIVRGHGAGMKPGAERLVHLPRGHGEALTDAWGNMYAEIAVAVEARRAGRALPEGLLQTTNAATGARGLAFVEAAADSNEAGGAWTPLARIDA